MGHLITVKSSTMPHVRAGRLRALAGSTGKRLRSVPDLAAVVESGVPEFALDQRHAVFASAKTPLVIVKQLYGEVAKTSADPAVKTWLLKMSLDPVGSAPDEFAAYVKAETAKWGKLVRDAGIKFN